MVFCFSRETSLIYDVFAYVILKLCGPSVCLTLLQLKFPFCSTSNFVFMSGELMELFDQDGYVDQARKERLEAS